ncbi:MAG: DMT family transporter, partial [Proteobacteria bacterium]|nr:DMT family transporter [Pseudomonadota bacterium]
MLAIGIAQTVFGQIPFFLGLHTTTAINGGLITATQPALIFLLAWIVFREPASLSQLAGLVVALIGALAVILRGDVVALLQLHFVAGDLLVQLGVLSWAMFAILVRQAPDALSPLVIFEAMTLASIVALAPCYAAEMLIWDNYTRVDLPTVITVLYLALFASILALVFLSMGIRRLGPSRSGVYNYLIPIFTALLAVLVLAETIETYHFVG